MAVETGVLFARWLRTPLPTAAVKPGNQSRADAVAGPARNALMLTGVQTERVCRNLEPPQILYWAVVERGEAA